MAFILNLVLAIYSPVFQTLKSILSNTAAEREIYW